MLLADQEFVVHEIHGALRVRPNRWVTLEIGFGKDALAGLPPLALIDTQDGRHLCRRQRPGLCQESVHVGPLSPTPQGPKLFGRGGRLG